MNIQAAIFISTFIIYGEVPFFHQVANALNDLFSVNLAAVPICGAKQKMSVVFEVK